jgi:hypothetical protein
LADGPEVDCGRKVERLQLIRTNVRLSECFGGSAMRRVLSLILVVAFVTSLMSGCSRRDEQSDSLVLVPDIVGAVHSRDFSADYGTDSKTAAIARSSYVDGALEAVGLKTDLVSVPGSDTDSQNPPAGTLVEPGTVVSVHLSDGQ